MSFEAFITHTSEQGNVIGSVRIIINIIYYNIYYVYKNFLLSELGANLPQLCSDRLLPENN